MIKFALNFTLSVAAAFVFDWLVCGRIAAGLSKFNYRYRPTFRRILFVAFLAVLVAYVALYQPPESYRVIFLALLGLLTLSYFGVAFWDVTRQNLPEVPPRYSERD
jgi:hypothetical protein